jgi:hypothetical protein
VPMKRHKPEEIVAKLRQVDVLVSQGQSVAEAVRSIWVTDFTSLGYTQLPANVLDATRRRAGLRWSIRAPRAALTRHDGGSIKPGPSHVSATLRCLGKGDRHLRRRPASSMRWP